MSTVTVADTFTITGRGTVLTGERVGPIHTGQYLYGPRFGFQIRGIEQFGGFKRDERERDNVGVLVGVIPPGVFQEGEMFSTDRPVCKKCEATTAVCQ